MQLSGRTPTDHVVSMRSNQGCNWSAKAHGARATKPSGYQQGQHAGKRHPVLDAEVLMTAHVEENVCHADVTGGKQSALGSIGMGRRTT
jgi:hypothetical protein